jgi:phosphoribosylaminoimidazole-succinocarboxamide synthase
VKSGDTFLEGKTKSFYNTEKRDQLILEFKDVIEKIDDKKKKALKGKGAINSEISQYLFEYLGSYNVPTQFIRRLDETKLLIKKLDMIPIKLVIWNVATGSLAKRLGLKEGTNLETPVLEFYLKNADLKNPLINDYHAYTLGLCDRDDMNAMVRIGSKVNAVLKSFFTRKKLFLVNFSLEFGKSDNQILIGDELSADNLTVWEILDNGNFEKNSLLISPENTKTVYTKIKDKILS